MISSLQHQSSVSMVEKGKRQSGEQKVLQSVASLVASESLILFCNVSVSPAVSILTTCLKTWKTLENESLVAFQEVFVGICRTPRWSFQLSLVEAGNSYSFNSTFLTLYSQSTAADTVFSARSQIASTAHSLSISLSQSLFADNIKPNGSAQLYQGWEGKLAPRTNLPVIAGTLGLNWHSWTQQARPSASLLRPRSTHPQISTMGLISSPPPCCCCLF